jgi:hypothetical protein
LVRAKKCLQQEHGAKDALKWAYVAALVLLLPYCIMFPFIWAVVEGIKLLDIILLDKAVSFIE